MMILLFVVPGSNTSWKWIFIVPGIVVIIFIIIMKAKKGSSGGEERSEPESQQSK